MMMKEQMMKTKRKSHKRMKMLTMKKKKKRKRKEKEVKMKNLQDLIQELHLEGYKRIILKHKS